ncbi:MAG: hypothetical protein RLZZ59_86, partial [Pseudomonadota bacterium]
SMIEMGIENSLGGNVKVMTYDIAEFERMPTVVKKMKSRGTSIILGPIFSAEASEIVPLIKPYGMTMITLSNNPALASENVYVFGHAPMKQLERMIDYTLSKGHREYITILPSSSYSSEIVAILANQVAPGGGKLVKSEFYTDKVESIDLAIQNIVSIVDNINELEDSETKPVLYLSDNDPVVMKRVFDAIKKYNLDIKTTLVGDNKLYISYEDPINLMFTGVMNDEFVQFQLKAKESLGIRHLSYMDLLAYDLGNVIASTLGQDLKHDAFIARLNYGHVYEGLSGRIKFDNGVAQRKYDIVKREGLEYSLVDAGR